ncbi:MAG: tetratricopeptide repeat protein [Bryobacterales bacterium]|nr:tetratricopeptide repeat protein [Bryobacterales bacterium]
MTSYVRVICALLFVFLLSWTPSVAQEESSPPSSPPPPAQTPPPAPAPGWTPPPPFEDTRNVEQRSPYFATGPSSVTGTLKRADNKPFPDDAVVEAVCQGQVVAATQSRRHFQLLLQRPGGDGGSPGLQLERGLAGCEIHARLSGFQPAKVALGSLSPGQMNVGLMVLHPLGDASGFSYTGTTIMAPKNARKDWEKGRALLAKGDSKEAVRLLRQATSAYPRFAMAWFELGIAYHQMAETEEARKAYAAAIDADNLFLPPYVQLAMLAAGHRAWPVVEGLTAEVIRRNPYEFPQAFLYHSAASYNLGKLEAAERSARRAIELDRLERLPRAHLLLARILTETNRTAEAAPVIARYLEMTEGKPDAEEAQALLRAEPVKPEPFLPARAAN